MKKQTIYTTLALSSLLLVGSYVGHADDSVPVVVATTPDVDETIDDGTAPITAPELSPVVDAGGASEPIVAETTPGTGTVDETIDEQPPAPSTETAEAPSVDGASSQLNEEQDKPQEPTPAVVTFPQVITPSLEEPVITPTGVTIVSTENSQLIVQTETGQLEVVAPGAIGAVRQADGIVAVQDKDGQLKFLPATGDEEQVLVSVLGLVSILTSVLLKVIAVRRATK